MNYQLLHAINSLSGHSRFLDNVMIFSAKYLIYLVFVGLAAAALPFVRRRQWSTLATAAGALTLAFALGLLATAVSDLPK